MAAYGTCKVWAGFCTSSSLSRAFLRRQGLPATLHLAIPRRSDAITAAPTNGMEGNLLASLSYPCCHGNPANMHFSGPPAAHRCLHTTPSALYSLRRGKLSSIEDAQKFLAALPVPQRTCLEKAVMESRKGEGEEEEVTPPTRNQLKHVHP